MTELLRRVAAVNVGLASFGEAVRDQGAEAIDVDWGPPAGGDPTALRVLERLWGRHGDRVEVANREAVARLEATRPCAVGVAPAGHVVPGLQGRMLLHAGPPIAWEQVCDPQRRAMVAACLFEGWAADRDAAALLLGSGAVALAPGNEHDHVGAMTGICSPSMPVWVAEDAESGARAFSTLNEGPGRTLWFGVGDDVAIERLRFFRDEAGPLLARLLEREGPIDVFAIAAQAVQMGDELHMRSQAAGHLLLRELVGGFAALGGERTARFMASNHHVFLSLTMAAAKCASLAMGRVEGSSVVALIARNGTDMGIQLAGLPGRWFTAPAAPVQDALLREGFGADDAAADIGDSAVIECIGLGGMALAASPGVAAFFGGSAADAADRTRLMGEICAGRARRFTIPTLDGEGTPLGIDARLVVETGVTPQITTGVLHVSSGAGQIGAGVAHQPEAPFRAALAALAEALEALEALEACAP